jgi:hypothetical protein
MSISPFAHYFTKICTILHINKQCYVTGTWHHNLYKNLPVLYVKSQSTVTAHGQTIDFVFLHLGNLAKLETI